MRGTEEGMKSCPISGRRDGAGDGRWPGRRFFNGRLLLFVRENIPPARCLHLPWKEQPPTTATAFGFKQSPGFSHSFISLARRSFGFIMFFALSFKLLELVLLGRRQTVFDNADGSTLKPLKFRPDGTFQISIFEDLHYGENAWDAWGPQQDINTVAVIDTVLDAEPNVDLVVLNGDLITGDNAFLQNSTDVLDQLVTPLAKRGLSWASTYGNHDSDFNLSRSDLLAREQTWWYARTTRMVGGDDAGVTNYYLPVYGADCNSDTADGCMPDLLLWFFDSRGGNKFQEVDPSGNRVELPNWVDRSVVEWFQQTSAELVSAAGRTIPSLAFVHIPINATLASQFQGVDKNLHPGINDDKPLSAQGQNWCADGTKSRSCPHGGGQDVPFTSAIVSTPGLMAMFSAHDHGDTWCYQWDSRLPGMEITGNGVNLCFGQHSGYGGYGTWIRGSRQVVVSQALLKDSILDTYIRLESGDVVGSVRLNSTYGRDWYPSTPNDHTRCPTCTY